MITSCFKCTEQKIPFILHLRACTAFCMSNQKKDYITASQKVSLCFCEKCIYLVLVILTDFFSRTSLFFPFRVEVVLLCSPSCRLRQVTLCSSELKPGDVDMKTKISFPLKRKKLNFFYYVKVGLERLHVLSAAPQPKLRAGKL
jgi:hypothetical protein